MEPPRLLVIDDEPALAEFVANAARHCGYDPILTSDDEQFRSEFLKEPFACLAQNKTARLSAGRSALNSVA